MQIEIYYSKNLEIISIFVLCSAYYYYIRWNEDSVFFQDGGNWNTNSYVILTHNEYVVYFWIRIQLNVQTLIYSLDQFIAKEKIFTQFRLSMRFV